VSFDYKWLFDGVLGAAVIAVGGAAVGWLSHRRHKSQVKEDRSSWPDVLLQCEWPTLLKSGYSGPGRVVRKRPFTLRRLSGDALYNVQILSIKFGGYDVVFLPVNTLMDVATVYPIIRQLPSEEVITTHDLESLISHPPPTCDVGGVALEQDETGVEAEIPISVTYDDKNGDSFRVKYLLHYNSWAEKGEMIRISGIEKPTKP
jgi:hypothetical protein